MYSHFYVETTRLTLGGYVYHVLNQANGRLRIFRNDDDFLGLEQIMAYGPSGFLRVLATIELWAFNGVCFYGRVRVDICRNFCQ